MRTTRLPTGAPSAAGEYAEALGLAEVLDAWDAHVGCRDRRLGARRRTDPGRLLLDEPANHLDRDGLEFLTAWLRSREGGDRRLVGFGPVAPCLLR